LRNIYRRSVEDREMLKLGFIGAGTVGSALAVRLREKGYQVVAVASRRRGSAEKLASRVGGCEVCDAVVDVPRRAELIFITTPDDVIVSVAEQVDWPSGVRVLHCSGAHSLDVLKSATEKGALAGAFHPLQTWRWELRWKGVVSCSGEAKRSYTMPRQWSSVTTW
jgi:predicted short-subunit dehydrogenase-like oxidoreductase (DUF2520 family)